MCGFNAQNHLTNVHSNCEVFGEGKDPSKLLKSGGLSDKNTAFHHTQTHTHTHIHTVAHLDGPEVTLNVSISLSKGQCPLYDRARREPVTNYWWLKYVLFIYERIRHAPFTDN